MRPRNPGEEVVPFALVPVRPQTPIAGESRVVDGLRASLSPKFYADGQRGQMIDRLQFVLPSTTERQRDIESVRV